MFGSKQKNPAIQTLVGAETVVRGDVSFRGGFHIDGKVEGDVRSVDEANSFLSISESGCVEGSVEVDRVSLNGTVKGDLVSRGRLDLGPSARVVGDVHYKLLEMSIGAEVNGKLVHEGEKPASAGRAKSTPEEQTPEGSGADAP
jgi:cytoskeletal protein CcmA (bactofilin family)